MREENPGIVYCAISGYGQDGPKRDASGHDMNYLGLIGLLGLTGERGGEPGAGRRPDRRPRRRRADGGVRDHGGAARARRRPGQPGSGEGQMVDVSMADGALSWLAMVAGAYFADGVGPAPRRAPLAGSLICYRPYECADGWVSLGRARAEVLAGLVPRGRPRGSDRRPVRAARARQAARAGRGDLPRPHPRAVGAVRPRTRLLPGAGARARRGARLRARAQPRDGRGDRAARARAARSASSGSRSS